MVLVIMTGHLSKFTRLKLLFSFRLQRLESCPSRGGQTWSWLHLHQHIQHLPARNPVWRNQKIRHWTGKWRRHCGVFHGTEKRVRGDGWCGLSILICGCLLPTRTIFGGVIWCLGCLIPLQIIYCGGVILSLCGLMLQRTIYGGVIWARGYLIAYRTIYCGGVIRTLDCLIQQRTIYYGGVIWIVWNLMMWPGQSDDLTTDYLLWWNNFCWTVYCGVVILLEHLGCMWNRVRGLVIPIPEWTNFLRRMNSATHIMVISQCTNCHGGVIFLTHHFSFHHHHHHHFKERKLRQIVWRSAFFHHKNVISFMKFIPFIYTIQ